MKAATNKSEQMFRDGDLVINPGETVNVQEDRAEILARDYAWQFDVKDESKKAPHENEVKANTHAYQQPETEVAPSATKPVETPKLDKQSDIDAASSADAAGKK